MIPSTPHQAFLNQLAASGDRLPGGCSACHAEQTVRRDAPGVYRLTVHHDNTCPALRRLTRRRRR